MSYPPGMRSNIGPYAARARDLTPTEAAQIRTLRHAILLFRIQQLQMELFLATQGSAVDPAIYADRYDEGVADLSAEIARLEDAPDDEIEELAA